MTKKISLPSTAFLFLIMMLGLYVSSYSIRTKTLFAVSEPATVRYSSNYAAPHDAVDHTASVNETKEVLIHFSANVSAADRQNYLNSISADLLLWIAPLHVAKVRIPSETLIGDGIIGGTSGDALVEAVESDGIVYGTAEPNDPDLYDEQRMYAPELLGLFDAWDYTFGAPEVVVGVLDTGIASSHPEFAGRILDGYDFYNNDNDPEDDHGHGTHVAGTVGATVNNGIGGAGLCGQCSILPIKVLNQNNAGTWSGVAAGIIFAADNKADIIVMSLGSTSGTQVVEDAIDYALSKDVLIIAAAGNANSNRFFYPAAYDGVIGVGATDGDDERWVLSNYGPYVDVSAPGSKIYSTYKDLTNSYGGHVFMSGTSMATPQVGGLAGLIKSQDPTRTSAQVIDILLNTALDLGDPGRDDYFGEGRIDAAAALAYDASPLQKAFVAGMVWRDVDADGNLEGNESERISRVAITLYNSAGDVVGNTKSSSSGSWQITNLAAGSYRVSVEPESPDLIWTNPDDASVTVSAGQQYINWSLGFIEELPADSVMSYMSVNREGDDVVISWEVSSELVTGLALERAIDDSDYEVIKQYDLTQSVSARSTESFADTLPEGTVDDEVSYRMMVSPGGSYLDSMNISDEEPLDSGTATPPTTTQPPPSSDKTIFLPWVSSQQVTR